MVHTPDVKYNYFVNYNFFLSQCLPRRVNGSRYRTAESIPRALSPDLLKARLQECEDETFYNIDGN